MESTYAYRYHCEPASREDDRRLCDQIRLAADYRRELAAIENRQRALLRSASWRAQAPRLKAVADRKGLEVATREVAAASRPEDKDEIDLAAADLVRRFDAPIDLVRAMILYERAKRVGNEALRAARPRAVALGLHWGTYQAVDEAFDASRRSTPFLEDVRVWCPRDVGLVAVHLQPARPLRSGYEDRWIQIGTGLVRRGSKIDRSGRVRPARHREVRLRVGTDGEGLPAWATLLVRMHRELPDGAVISWAKAKRRRVGARYRWELHLTIATQSSSPAHPRPEVSCGVDIGWRRVEGGVRIASWWGTDGAHGDLVVPNATLSIDDKADSLRQIRDRNRNALRDQLRAWLAELGERRPTWLVEATMALHAWLKAGRFVRLARLWRDQRFPGDDAAWAALEDWMKQDRHLWNWEASSREKRQRKVADQIRVFAVGLCRAYGRIGVEAPLTAELVRKPRRAQAAPGDGDLVTMAAMETETKTKDERREDDHLRRIAATRVPHVAPALTRRELKTFAPKYGALVVELNPADTTLRCDACGYRRDDVVDWSPIEVGCSACGAIKDQDQTAATNLARLASAVVLGEDGRPLAPARSKASAKKLGVRRTRKATEVETARR